MVISNFVIFQITKYKEEHQSGVLLVFRGEFTYQMIQKQRNQRISVFSVMCGYNALLDTCGDCAIA